MKRPEFAAACVALALLGATLSGAAQIDRRVRVSTERVEKLKAAWGDPARLAELGGLTRTLSLDSLRVPLVFEQNRGQADRRFAYVLRGVGFAAGFSSAGITARVAHYPKTPGGDPVALDGQIVQILFRGAGARNLKGQLGRTPPGRIGLPAGTPPVQPSGRTTSGVAQVIRGSDPARWLHDVPVYSALVFDEVFRDVQMVAKASEGRLQYGLVLGPRATLRDVRLGVRGVTRLTVGDSGNLLMRTSGGTIVQTRPRFVEKGPRGSRVLKGRFKVYSDTEYGFEVDGWTRGTRLLIDPEIVLVTYFGGSGNEGTLEVDRGGEDFHGQGFDIAIGPDGNVFVVGTTVSPDFPATASGPAPGGSDAFVLRLDPTLPPGHQLVYATFVGGSGFERGVAVAPDEEGRVYVTGCTTSADFPASADGFVPSRQASVGYLVRLGTDGFFERGTFIGQTRDHHPASVAFSRRTTEAAGFVYLAGSVAQGAGAGDALPGGFQTGYAGGQFDGFVVKLDADLTQASYLTYLGGSARDVIRDLAVNDGFTFVTGSTTSIDFPATELAVQPQHSQATTGVDCVQAAPPRQCFDAFVTRLNRDGSGLIYSTFFGGETEEFGRGIAAVAGNQVTFTGAARPTSGDATQILVARLEGGGENLLWETRIPAAGSDHGEEVVVDAFGRAHVVGTVSVDGLSTSASSFGGGASDIFYSRHAAATGEVELFTYLGGTGVDRGFAVAAQGTSEQNFCALIAGSTTSQDLETVNPLEGGETLKGRADLLIAALCDVEGSITPGSGFTKSVDRSLVTVGETFHYTINVINGGDVPVPVTVRDTPPSTVVVTGVQGPGFPSHAGNQVTDSFTAQPGANPILITVSAGPTCPSTVRNSATVTVGSEEFPSNEVETSIACVPPLCPNHQLNAGEECDDGNSAAGDGCRPNCTLERCGDGIRDPGEACDDGDAVDDNGCSNGCRVLPAVNDECTGDPRCQGDLVCGKHCSFVDCDGGIDIFDFCIFGDSYQLCDVDYTCMPAARATYTRSR